MTQKNNQFAIGMSVISSIFFIFGFATTFIITLSAKVKDIFTLSELEAQLLTGAFFLTYLFLSIPTGYIIRRIGYKTALVTGLLLMAVGSFMFYPAATAPSFPLFLAATFVLAAGVVFLQTSANPYVAALGSEVTASGRLNLTQALNSIATMIAPWIIAVVIFKGVSEIPSPQESAQTVKMPFLLMGSIVLLVAMAIVTIQLPAIAKGTVESKKSVWKYPHVLLGAVAIFCYVGAEVGNAGLLVNFLNDKLQISKENASTYAAIYWGGAMVGRFFGSIMLSDIQSRTRKTLYFALVLMLALVSGAFVTDWNWNIGAIFLGTSVVNLLAIQLGRGNASLTLGVFALIAAALAIVTTFAPGQLAIWTLVSIGLFNSVMFPNIFGLAVKDLSNGEMSTASGIINTLIVGGAIVPVLMGAIADSPALGYSWAFVVPALCYLYIFFFAVKGSKMR
ncbi:FHS family L-fucose permease-like MFS transporter [Breznakibacter xylanolyticus]|uniref:FHS family L-fucose permease-like MFS transporter n=1 Tax=Breznakibacter xylanolyticus TaxID=990 RepID=A0A2W7NJM5_9BACT|nr:MFS transporter [Breznakibacter xylanolyticus]PZX20070.1 FHS family L-fucose permease-like MFS transporter [Breznakibacter xylanolyticus]